MTLGLTLNPFGWTLFPPQRTGKESHNSRCHTDPSINLLLHSPLTHEQDPEMPNLLHLRQNFIPPRERKIRLWKTRCDYMNQNRTEVQPGVGLHLQLRWGHWSSVCSMQCDWEKPSFTEFGKVSLLLQSLTAPCWNLTLHSQTTSWLICILSVIGCLWGAEGEAAAQPVKKHTARGVAPNSTSTECSSPPPLWRFASTTATSPVITDCHGCL